MAGARCWRLVLECGAGASHTNAPQPNRRNRRLRSGNLPTGQAIDTPEKAYAPGAMSAGKPGDRHVASARRKSKPGTVDARRSGESDGMEVRGLG